MQPPVTDSQPKPIHILLSGLVLIVLVSIGYKEAPNNIFHFDDFANIVEHEPMWLTALSLDGLINAAENAMMPSRPLPNMSFALDWWRGGGDPSSFQWTNLTLHVLTSLAVFALLLLLMRQYHGQSNRHGLICALLGAIFWAIHPIQIQGVTYIVQRMASMAAFFTIISVYSYIRARLSPSFKSGALWGVGSCLAAICGIASKENAWIIPILILLAEYGVCRHTVPLIRRPIDYFWLLLPWVAGIFVIFNLIIESGPLYQYVINGYSHRDFTLSERLLTQPRVILFHLSQIVWPLPERFSIEHDFTISKSLTQPASTLGAILFLACWVTAGIWLLLTPKGRLWGFCLLWFPISLLIESSIIPIEMVFEHRMYLPSVGLAGLLSITLLRLSQISKTTYFSASCILGIFLLGCLVSTSQRIPIWSSKLSLYESVLSHAPRSPRVLATLAQGYIQEGRSAEGAALARQAIQYNPKAPIASLAWESLAIVLMDQGNLHESEQHILRAFYLDGPNHHLLNHWGEIKVKQKQYRKALDLFAQAIDKHPWIDTYYWNIAVTYEYLKDCKSAKLHWNRFLELGSDPTELQMVKDHLQEEHFSPSGKCAA